MKNLILAEFGSPILRKKTRELTVLEIKSKSTQQLIMGMSSILLDRKLGVGLSAPQVDKNIALAVIRIRSTKHRPKAEKLDLVLINPRIIRNLGSEKQLWEGCISAGKSGLFAKVPRYQKVEVKYIDEKGNKKVEVFNDLPAQVIQHEVDHLNGKLFMDRVKDSSTYMTMKEYKRRIVSKKSKSVNIKNK